MRFRVVILLIVLINIFSSCRKDKDDILPVVIISSPSENQVFSALDTIPIVATIEDETNLELVEIVVCDNNKAPVLSPVTIKPEEKNISINLLYIMDDITLASGNYYLRIKAFDGINTVTKYRTIQVSEVAREMKYIYIMSYFNSTTIQLQRKIIGDSLENLFYVNSDYCSTASNSKFQLYSTCGKIYGDMNIYDVSSNTLQWSVPVVSDPPFPYFTNNTMFNNLFYCSFYNGSIKGYQNNGTQIFASMAPTGSYPVKLFANEDYVFADHACYSGQERRFGVYYNSSGAMKQQLTTDFEITNMFQKNNDELIVFGNGNGQGIVKIYSISNNGFWDPHALPTGLINDAVQIDENNYIFSLGGNLYKYQYNMNSLTTYLSGVNASVIKYDDIYSQLYVAVGNTIIIYDYETHALNSSITAANTVLGFEMIYNK